MLTTRELRALSRDLTSALAKLRTVRIEDDKVAPAAALILSVKTRIDDAIPEPVTPETEPAYMAPEQPQERTAALVVQLPR